MSALLRICLCGFLLIATAAPAQGLALTAEHTALGSAAVAALVGAAFAAGITHRAGRAARASAREATLLDAAHGAAPDAAWLWPQGSTEGRPSLHLRDLLGLPAGGSVSFPGLLAALPAGAADALEHDVRRLREHGVPFIRTIELRPGRRLIEVLGTVLKGARGKRLGEGLWFRDISERQAALDQAKAQLAELIMDHDRLRETVETLGYRVWRRYPDLTVSWGHASYLELAGATEGQPGGVLPELGSSAERAQARALARRAQVSGVPQDETSHVVLAGHRRLFRIREMPLGLNGALIGFGLDISELDEVKAELARRAQSEAAVLESLATPVEIYGRDRRLRFANRAFVNLWRLDEGWLAAGPTQGEVLDAMRRNRTLPEQADFRAFTTSRLKLFTDLIDPLEELLHLPDGTTLRMVVTPHPDGGLLYFYQDASDLLVLERARNLLIAVQRATLDHLAEAVAVFGSDGRLKLWNPRYARMWQLDAGFLTSQPHIGEVIERARALLDGGGDWAA